MLKKIVFMAQLKKGMKYELIIMKTYVLLLEIGKISLINTILVSAAVSL